MNRYAVIIFSLLTLIATTITCASFDDYMIEGDASFDDYMNEGYASFELDNFHDAIRAYTDGESYALTSSQLSYSNEQIGRCYLYLQDNDSALKAYERAYLYEPTERLHALVAQLKNEDGTAVSRSMVVKDVKLRLQFLNDDVITLWREILGRAARCGHDESRSLLTTFFEGDRDIFAASLVSVVEQLQNYGILPTTKRYFSVTIVYYKAGGRLHLHKDDNERVGNEIAIISLGATAKIIFEDDHSREKFNFGVPEGSVWAMKNRAHTDYRHGVAKLDGDRICVIIYVPASKDHARRFDTETGKLSH